MGSFKFSNDFEPQLNKAVEGALGDVAKDYQRMFDFLSRRYQGRPVSAIKPVLQREWKRIGGSITDPADRVRHAHQQRHSHQDEGRQVRVPTS